MAKTHDFDHFLMMKKIILSKGKIEVEIVSDSMEPLIDTGELVEVWDLKEELNLFDIIVFWREAQFVAHFIWQFNGISHKTVSTRSLKNKSSNELPVELDHILGIIKAKKIGLFTKIFMRLFYAK